MAAPAKSLVKYVRVIYAGAGAGQRGLESGLLISYDGRNEEMAMTETVPPSAADPVADRIDKLEKTVTRLRKKVRRLERAVPPIEMTPELAAEIDRLEAEVFANPDIGVPWEVAQAEILANLAKIKEQDE
jgi:hypothetical protein